MLFSTPVICAGFPTMCQPNLIWVCF